MIECISNYFYSNCLIEALKAKFKEPENVKIVKAKSAYKMLPHFLWDKGDGYLYDFGTNHKIVTPLFFQGYLRRRHVRSEKMDEVSE